MLEIIVEPIEGWDSRKEEFLTIPGGKLVLEHSLVSLSKWESKWHKPFLREGKKTPEEILDYIKCMTVSKQGTDDIYNHLSNKNIDDINNYIEDPMTATTFTSLSSQHQARQGEFITSELIYYWMIALNIPFECEKWHLERLLTLIRICNDKNAPPKKMSKEEIMERNRALNAQRRAKLHTKG